MYKIYPDASHSSFKCPVTLSTLASVPAVSESSERRGNGNKKREKQYLVQLREL